LGKLIVFEGIDGSGKSTQFDLMCSRLATESRDFVRIRFPRYENPSSALIKMYLDGELGHDPDSVNAYAASSFFAVDRFASYVQDWRGHYESGRLILTDRYTTSNAIHQGAKLPPEQRESFFKWLYEYEFDLIGLPAPDIVIYMDIEANNAALRLTLRQTITGTHGDIHEQDLSYLNQCVVCGKQAMSFYGWHRIACFSSGRERDAEEIHREAYDLLERFVL